MVTIKITRSEFQAMILFLRRHTQPQNQLPLIYQVPTMLLLMDYLASWTPMRQLSWSQRRPDKTFRLKLKPAIARSLHLEMQHVEVSAHQQEVLRKLDQAIINYCDPNHQPHVIGELIGMGSVR